MIRIVLVALLLAAVLACESPPAEGCKGRPGESGIDFDCGDSADAAWQDRSLDEAERGMEERSPGGRL
jgi:hypothetical protein